MQKRLAGFNVESDVLDEAELQIRFPMMNPEPFPKWVPAILNPKPQSPNPTLRPEPETRNLTP